MSSRAPGNPNPEFGFAYYMKTNNGFIAFPLEIEYNTTNALHHLSKIDLEKSLLCLLGIKILHTL